MLVTSIHINCPLPPLCPCTHVHEDFFCLFVISSVNTIIAFPQQALDCQQDKNPLIGAEV